MPTYEYKCEECGIVFERFQHFSDEPLKTCPECAGAIHRVIHPVGVIFKGKGFYVTDNRKSDANTSRPPKSEKTDSSESTEKPAKSSEPKSDKSDSTPASSE